MSGGITQLVATGAQDTHLVGQPEISFWQSSYKRHTNFSSVIERQTIVNTPSSNGISSVRFERKGDLLSYCYLTATDVYDQVASVDWSDIIDKVELYIGGQLIDTQTFEFTNKISPDVMASSFSRSVQGSAQDTGYFYPLKFWFSENWQSALPLLALQYHDVEMRIYWGSSASGSTGTDTLTPYNLYTSTYNAAIAAHVADYTNNGTTYPNATLAANDVRDRALAIAGLNVGENLRSALDPDGLMGVTVDADSGLIGRSGMYDNLVATDVGSVYYISAISLDFSITQSFTAGSSTVYKYEMWSRFVYLDTMERRSLSDRTTDYLIQQVQRIPSPESSRADLTFNHPCKFIATTSTNLNNTVRVLLQLNGTDVGDSIHVSPHYNQVSAFWHTQFGHDETTAEDGFKNVTMMIPFCLDASKLQPTGTVNFSRIDSARLVLNTSTFNAPIYAVNYNILRVQNGMAGLLYAN